MDKTNISVQQALSILDPVRQELQRQKNPEQNLLNLNKGLEGLKNALNDQLASVRTMKNIKKDTEKEGTSAQNKLKLESFLEVIERDIVGLLKLAKQRMIAPKNEKKGQDAGMTYQEQEFWKRIEEKYRDKINEVKLNIDSKNNFFEIIFKYLNIRDSLVIQNVKAFLYQQQILCKDLNIPSNEYVHDEIYKILSNMEQQQERAGFIHPKHCFEKPFVKHYETFKVEDSVNDTKVTKSLPITEYIKLAGQAFDHSESLLRNIFGLTNIDKEIAINNSKVVTSFLREELEAAHTTIAELGQKIHYLNGKIRSDARTDDEEVLRRELQQKDTLVQDLQRDVKLLNTDLSKIEKSNQMLKYHYNQLQESCQKLSGNYFPKLEETVEQLKKTIDEVEKIRKEVEFFSTMYRAEKRDKKFVETHNKNLEERMEKLAEVMGQLRNKNKFLKEEASQKDLISFELAKAIDESRTKLSQMEREIDALKKECKALKERENKVIKDQDMLRKLVLTYQTELKKGNRSEGLEEMITTILEERARDESKLSLNENVNVNNDETQGKYNIRGRFDMF